MPISTYFFMSALTVIQSCTLLDAVHHDSTAWLEDSPRAHGVSVLSNGWCLREGPHCTRTPNLAEIFLGLTGFPKQCYSVKILIAWRCLYFFLYDSSKSSLATATPCLTALPRRIMLANASHECAGAVRNRSRRSILAAPSRADKKWHLVTVLVYGIGVLASVFFVDQILFHCRFDGILGAAK